MGRRRRGISLWPNSPNPAIAKTALASGGSFFTQVESVDLIKSEKLKFKVVGGKSRRHGPSRLEEQIDIF